MTEQNFARLTAWLLSVVRKGGMQFVFDEPKAAEAAARLVQLGGGRMSVLKLIKLLYLADRRSLVETGFPITQDQMVSMPHGPVLSTVYNRIRDDRAIRSATFDRYIKNVGNHTLELVEAPPEIGRLSRYQMALLGETFRMYGGWPESRLRKYTHDLPEWHDPAGSMIPIQHIEIFRGEGQTKEQIDWRERLADSFAKIESRSTA